MSDEQNERMTEDMRRTWGAYVKTLAVLREECPDDARIAEMSEIVKTDPVRFVREFPYKARAARADAIGVKMSGVDWLPSANAPYINRQGYSHLLQNDARKIRSVRCWTKVYPFLITTPERDDKIVGASEDGTCVAVCRIEFQNGEEYEEEGTSSPRNVGSMVKERLIEMAHTRAFNRCAAMATGRGLVSAEEIRERLEPVEKAEDPAVAGAREKAKEALANLTQAERVETLIAVAKTVNPDTLSIEDADRVCKAVAEKIEKRGKRDAEKKARNEGKGEGRKKAKP